MVQTTNRMETKKYVLHIKKENIWLFYQYFIELFMFYHSLIELSLYSHKNHGVYYETIATMSIRSLYFHQNVKKRRSTWKL